MEQRKHQVLDVSPNRRGKGKKSTLRHVGDDATRLEIWIHPSHPRSCQGHESGRDSEQDNGLGSLSPSDVSTAGASGLMSVECSGMTLDLFCFPVANFSSVLAFPCGSSAWVRLRSW